MGALRWHTKNIIIGALRNWSRTALEWDLASDPEYALHTASARGAGGASHQSGRRPGRRYLSALIGELRMLSVSALGEVYPAGVGAGSFKYGRSASQRDLLVWRLYRSRMVMVVMNGADGAKALSRSGTEGAYATLELGPVMSRRSGGT